MKEKSVLAPVAGVCLILLQAACGGGATGPAAPAQVPPVQALPTLGPVVPALVGAWTGTLGGSFGPADLAMNLNADATAWFEGTGRYCTAVGNWGVSGTEFTVRGSDCTGTLVIMVAPVSSTSMAGTWTASSGRSGTFTATK